MRTIRLGRGFAQTTMTPAAIASLRSWKSEDPELFLRTFANVRKVGASLSRLPMDLEMICTEFTRHSATMEAAMIEGLASLRAEGVKL